MRLPGSGSVKENTDTFNWSGRRQEAAIHGIGFAISGKLAEPIWTPIGASENIMKVKLNRSVLLNIVYACVTLQILVLRIYQVCVL